MKIGLWLLACALAATVALPGVAHARLIVDGTGPVAKKLHVAPKEEKKSSASKSAKAPKLGKGFIWPVVETINTHFGGDHAGIDIEGVTGDPIVAAQGGTVTFAGDDGDGYGVKVVIDHGDGYETLYSHLSSISTSMGPIDQGDLVGAIGCTGSCSGDHLHFEILLNGVPIDPVGLLP